MNKLFTAALGLAVAVLPVLGAGVAAAEEPANCADAVTVLARADAAHKAAVEADENLADAIEADQALKDAKADLRQAEKKRDLAQADVTAKEGELARLNEVVDGEKVGTPGQIANAEKALKEANRVLADRKDDVKDAKDEVKKAKDAAEDKVRDLRAKANETDAAALKVELDAARDDFNRLCTEGEDDPTDNGDSNTSDDSDNDSVDTSSNDTVVTPSGGVNTGAGPA